MTKASLETSSDPLRVLNKDIHEMIGTFPSLFPKLSEKLVRRFIKAAHVSHDERNEIAGYNIMTMGVLQRKLATCLSHSVLQELVEWKHFSCTNARMLTSTEEVASWPVGSTISLSGRLRQVGTITSLDDKKHFAFVSRLMASHMALCSICLDVHGQTKALWPQQSDGRLQN